MTAQMSEAAASAIAGLVLVDAHVRGYAVECEPPAWSMASITNDHTGRPVAHAVEEILQLRHDVDDHALAVTLLRGIRPDLTVEGVEGWISRLLAEAATVRDAELSGSRSDFDWAVDVYDAALHTFTGGRS